MENRLVLGIGPNLCQQAAFVIAYPCIQYFPLRGYHHIMGYAAYAVTGGNTSHPFAIT